jgi:hypothetical protein
MDINLHLLTSEQIKLLQDICLSNTYIDGFDGFLETRNNVDVVILNDETDYDEFKETLASEEKRIREKIKKELDRRETERSNDERPEQRPNLPNYDSDEADCPSIFDWGEDQPLMDDSYFNNMIEDGGLDVRWLRPREEITSGKSMNGNWDRLNYQATILAEDIKKMQDKYLSDEAELIYTNGLNNFELMLLDNELGRIKWDRYRHNKALEERKSGTVTYWSGSLLGRFSVRIDGAGKIVSRTIFLFMDTIRTLAQNHPLIAQGTPVTENDILAEVFVHEMFHAYFNTKSKKFITSSLKGVREIEEAITEYAMLYFLRNSACIRTDSFVVAKYNVRRKFASKNPLLHCYGLGAHLYDCWHGKNLMKASLLPVYQKIQRAPRLSVRLVREYIKQLQSSSANPNRCMRYLYEIIAYYDTVIPKEGDHYSFNDKNYGQSNHMIYAVLEYYSKHTGSDFVTMSRDFDHDNVNLYGSRPIFMELSRISNDDLNRYYDTTSKRQLKLSDGTVIVPLKLWEDSKNGGIHNFLKRVMLLYTRGIMDRVVRVLR